MSAIGHNGPVVRSAHRLDVDRFRRTDDAVTDETTTRFFADLLFPKKLTEGLSNAGFVHPSPIQWAALPMATKVGLDLVVQSKSGTGKTLVYVITALNMINTDNDAIQAIVLAPTREIAVQGARVALDIAGACMPELKVHTFIGGMAVTDDQVKLKKCHLAIGTPGRMKQLLEENLMLPHSIRFLALDEADRLMDPSFKNDVTWIFNKLPTAKQVMALSATYPDDLAKLLTTYMKDPSHVRLNQDCQVLKGVSQYVIELSPHPQSHEQDKLKFEALLTLLTSVTFSQCLVFTNYVTKAESFCEKLNGHGWPAIFISSSQDQPTRLRALTSLKQFQCRVLLTTDLTARGIDAHNVNLIINLEVPWDAETYLHRIGRAGRFGSYGVAVSLPAQGFELDLLRNIVFQTGSEIKILPYSRGSKECLPDLWKIQQIKNGMIPAPIHAGDSQIAPYEILEPLEVLEEAEPFEELHPDENVQDTLSSIFSKEVELEKPKKKRSAARQKKNKSRNGDSSLGPEIQGFVQNGKHPTESGDCGGENEMYFEMITDIKAEPFYPETGYLPSFTPTVTQQEMEAHMAEHEAEDRRQLELIQSRLKNTQFFVETIHTVKLNDSEIEVGDYEDNSTGHGTTNDFDPVEHIDECDYAEEYEYDKEEDDISESGALTPNLIIKHYKKITGYQFSMPEDESENCPVPEFKISRDQQMSEVGACGILRQFCNRDVENTEHAAISAIPTLLELEAQVHAFLKNGKSGDELSNPSKATPVDPKVVEAFKIFRQNLELDWSKQISDASLRVTQAGDLDTALKKMLRGEELPLLHKRDTDKQVDKDTEEAEKAASEDKADVNKKQRKNKNKNPGEWTTVDATNPDLLDIFNVKEEVLDLSHQFSNTRVTFNCHLNNINNVSPAKMAPKHSVEVKKEFASGQSNQIKFGDDYEEDYEEEECEYPEPYRANWEEVDKSQMPKKGHVIWSVEDGVAPFVDEDDTEVEVDTFSQSFRDITSDYAYPFPDPDAVLAGFLGIPDSWKTSFPAWLEHVRRNKEMIEHVEYQKRLARLLKS